MSTRRLRSRNPAGALDSIFADEAVGVLDAFAGGGVGEGDDAVAKAAEIDLDAIALVGGAGLDGGDVEGGN